MARPKNETKPNAENEVTKTVDKPVVDETAELKAKLAAQEKQMAEMMAKMQEMMNAQMATPTSVIADNKQTRSIKFINLASGGLTLKGNRFYHMDKQFDSRMIPESEARAIVNNMPNTMVSGVVYIADADFVREVELDGAYAEMLSDEQVKSLLHKSAAEVCDIYRNASDTQKRIIVDMVSDRRLQGLPVDANIVVELGKLCGKDLMGIEPENE